MTGIVVATVIIFALLIGGEMLPGLALLVRDNVDHVLLEPFLVRTLKLFAQFGILEADSGRLEQTEREAGSSEHTYVHNPPTLRSS